MQLMEIMENSCGKLECLQQYFGMNSVDNQLLASGVGLGDGDSDNNSSIDRSLMYMGEDTAK